MAAISLGAEHDDFELWAREQGVQINGIKAARFPGRGLGMVSTKALKEGDVLITVPAKTLITTDNVHVKKQKLPNGLSVHGQLAACITLWDQDLKDGRIPYGKWFATWPTREDFLEYMPIMWPSELQELLPPAAKDLLDKQKKKSEKDYAAVEGRLPPESRELFMYNWLAINTRCFYWDHTAAGRLRRLSHDDCMALCPFVDYFNHADHGCVVTENARGYTVICDRDYESGEEVYVSYGTHSNDFLLVEYGFILAENAHDSLSLDHIILPRLSASQKDELKDEGFLGNYTLSTHPPPPQVCHRTQVALRALKLPGRRWMRYAAGEEDENSEVQDYCRVLLRSFLKDALTSRAELEEMSSTTAKDTLARRWKQIEGIIESAIAGMKA